MTSWESGSTRPVAAGAPASTPALRWMGVDITFADDGTELIADTPAERAAAFDAYDGAIAMEKRGHVNSDGRSWNDRWLDDFAGIRASSENPDVLIAYIVSHRRAVGLPELELEREPAQEQHEDDADD